MSQEFVDRVRDTVDVGEFGIVHLGMVPVRKVDFFRGRGGIPRRDTQEGVEGVCHSFDLFDCPMVLDRPEMEYCPICGGDEDGGVDRPGSRFELTVEKVTEGFVLCEVGFGEFVEVATKDPRVERKAIRSEPYGQFETIHVSP